MRKMEHGMGGKEREGKRGRGRERGIPVLLFPHFVPCSADRPSCARVTVCYGSWVVGFQHSV